MKQPNSKPNELTTLIGDGCLFEGDLTSSSSTRIDGKVRGNIKSSGCIIVGERGEISGEVKGIEVIVFGRIEGNVQSERLEIKKNAVVRGTSLPRPY